jgi:branched-chain amino acid transport system substrate-binding protein
MRSKFIARLLLGANGPWDYYKLVGTTPADQAFRPISESACPVVKK